MSALTVIAHTELASAGSIVLSSIPGSYTDLMLVVSLRNNVENPFIGFRVNGLTSGINTTAISGDGSGGGSSVFTRTDDYIGSIMHANATANAFGTFTAYIPNYTSSNAKMISYELFGSTANTNCFQQIGTTRFNTSAAVSSLTVYNWGGGALSPYSSATLYGVTAGSGGVTVS
jgi:hypothetical protein